MNLDEAGRLQKAWKTKHGDKPCHHTRVIDPLLHKMESPLRRWAVKNVAPFFRIPAKTRGDNTRRGLPFSPTSVIPAQTEI